MARRTWVSHGVAATILLALMACGHRSFSSPADVAQALSKAGVACAAPNNVGGNGPSDPGALDAVNCPAPGTSLEVMEYRDDASANVAAQTDCRNTVGGLPHPDLVTGRFVIRITYNSVDPAPIIAVVGGGMVGC